MRVSQIVVGAVIAAGMIGIPAGAQAANFFSGDTVRGHTPKGATGPGCVLSNQYMREESVVFRVRVLQEDGKPADDKVLKSLVIKLGDGKTIPMKYGNHPHTNPTDLSWATSWLIPADFPTGTLGYTVIATDMQGATEEWSPFKVEFSNLTVIPGDVTFTK